MSSITSLAGAMMSADATTDAANTASRAQIEAAQMQIDAMMQMWQQAQTDFAPYLNAGYGGLEQLQTALPQYVQNTLMPIAQQYGSYQYSALPNANYTINPLTGEMISQPAQTSQQGSASQQMTALQQAGQQPSMYAGGSQTFNEAANAPTLPATASRTQPTPTQSAPSTPAPSQYITNPAYQEFIDVNANQGLEYYDWYKEDLAQIPQTIVNPEYTAWQNRNQQATQPGATMPAVTQPSYTATPANISNYQISQPTTAGNYNLASIASAQDLSQGGVLAPSVPTLNQGQVYSFNENDPTYQTMLAQKNREIDAFLAKQGLQGSSAGEAFRQRQLDQFRAEQDTTQYNRFTGERDYATQTALDQYGMEASRGNTLYDRLYGQYSDLYNRNLTSAQLADQQALGQIANQYSAASDVYNTLYGANTALAQFGAGAAGSVSSAGGQAGAGIAGAYQQMGDAQAQAALMAGQANAGMWNALGSTGSNALSQYYNSPWANTNYGNNSYYNAADYGNTGGYYQGSAGSGGDWFAYQ